MLGPWLGLTRSTGATSPPTAPCIFRLLSTLVAGDPPQPAITASAGGQTTTPAVSISYLTGRCGLSADKATKVSKCVSHLTSTSNPDAVLAFLRRIGLSDADFASIVSGYPRILCSSVDKYLAPNVSALGKLGFLTPQIARLIVATPSALPCRRLAQRVQFWIEFLGSSDMVMQALKYNSHLLTTDVDRLLLPNLNILSDCGLRSQHLRKPSMSPLLTHKHKILQDLVAWAGDLGVPRTSGVFYEALRVVNCLSKTTLRAKIAAMKSLGCSADEVLMAISKQPKILLLSLKMLQPKMEFLVKEFMLEPATIARVPVLLKYSLDRRLVPRHMVSKMLREKGLKVWSPVSTLVMGEENFLKNFVLANECNIPGLTKAYVATQFAKAPVDLLKD